MRQRRPSLAAMVAAVAIGAGSFLARAADMPPTPPLVTVLPDDTDTRGDWLGNYGTHAYHLCAMRSPVSLSGGKGWPIGLQANTGDPKDPARAWRSTAPAEHDRSVLMEPSGQRRTPASFDDHGEARPLGKGPDLYVRLEVPQGAFLLSLYFFETDWIQYRAYTVEVLNDGVTPPAKLAETTVADFLKGKYKRFLVAGPAKLCVVIRREQSPNAVLSGIFLDPVAAPDMAFLDLAQPLLPAAEIAADALPSLEEAQQAADAAFMAWTKLREDDEATRTYLQAERMVFRVAGALAEKDARAYAAASPSFLSRPRARVERAASALEAGRWRLESALLRYYAARLTQDLGAARRALAEATGLLLSATRRGGREGEAAATLLEQYVSHLLVMGPRAEAAIVLAAYDTAVLEREPPDVAKQKLVAVGRKALKASAPLPVAEALAQWSAAHGPLNMEEQLLLASLYYLGARPAAAAAAYGQAEPAMPPGLRHRWVLLAMISSLLRSDREDEALGVIQRLRAVYPGAAEIDEADYRLGAHYFEQRQLDHARACFEALQQTAKQETYRKYCREYLARIEGLAKP